MKIIGYGPKSALPFVPEYVKVDKVGCVSRMGKVAADAEVVEHEMDIPNGSWIGVHLDGTVESFPRVGETAWKVGAAMKGVQALSAPGADPQAALDALKACAAMLGVNAERLVANLTASKSSPDESLAAVFLRTKGKAP